jgi:hypothetical protein
MKVPLVSFTAILYQLNIAVTVMGINVNPALQTRMVWVSVAADLSSLTQGILPIQGTSAITRTVQKHINCR